MKVPSWLPGSSAGSQIRNLFTYAIAILALVLAMEATIAHFFQPLFTANWLGPTLAFLSALFFVIVVVWVIFIVSSDLGLNPIRLARDGLVSICFTVLAFAVWY